MVVVVTVGRIVVVVLHDSIACPSCLEQRHGWQGGRGKGHVQGGGLLTHIRHTLLTARLHTATQNGITGLARRQPQCREVPHPPHPKVSLGLTVKVRVTCMSVCVCVCLSLPLSLIL